MTLPVALSLVLALLAAAHAWWALGRIWPASSEPELARAVIGDGRVRMPPPWQCAAVAAALVAVALWPWVIMAWPQSQLVLIGSIVVGAVFFIRGTAGYSHAGGRASRRAVPHPRLLPLFAALPRPGRGLRRRSLTREMH